MRLKSMFPFLVLALGTFLIGACVVVAQTANGSPVNSPVFPQIPAWLQAVLAGGTVGGGAVFTALRSQLGKALMLIQDMKNVITESIGLFASIKSHITDPALIKEFNDACDAIAKMLRDTGNRSLVQKADMFEGFKRPIEETPAAPQQPVSA